MQSLTERVFKLGSPGGLFDEGVVRTLFPSASAGARKLLVHRAVKANEVLRLKPGHYCLAPEFRRSHPHPFVVAAVLHSPSHISLESALSYHRLIPEAVQTVSSVTIRRSRDYTTPLGHFSFQRVPATKPRAGVRAVQVEPEAWAFIAGPLRALADILYLRKDVRWRSHGIGFLTESMRMEEEDLARLATDDFDEIHASIERRRVREYLDQLRHEIGR